MGSPSRTRLQSCRYFSCWGPSLPWLLQPQRLNLQLLLIPIMAMGTVATDTVDTTGLMATMAMERGPLRLSQSPLLLPTLLLWLTPLLMLMPGTATTATDTVAMDTVATDTVDTTAPMATMAMERGPLRQSQSPLLLPTLTLLLIPGMAMATVATDTVDTTGLMATMATECTERGPQRQSQSPLLLLTPLLMLMPGTAIMATDTDTATTVHTDTDTMAMERGPQRLRQSPPLLPTLPLWLTQLLMLMPGTATTATVAMVATATATMAMDTDTATTGHTDMPTGAKQAKREVDSSSDCDFPSTLASISRACA